MAKKIQAHRKLAQLRTHSYDSRSLSLLSAALCDTSSADEVARLLEELLTPAELSAVVNRVAILTELENGTSYGAIQTKLQVSSATIASVAELKSHPSAQKLLLQLRHQQRIRATASALLSWLKIPYRYILHK